MRTQTRDVNDGRNYERLRERLSSMNEMYARDKFRPEIFAGRISRCWCWHVLSCDLTFLRRTISDTCRESVVWIKNRVLFLSPREKSLFRDVPGRQREERFSTNSCDTCRIMHKIFEVMRKERATVILLRETLTFETSRLNRQSIDEIDHRR